MNSRVRSRSRSCGRSSSKSKSGKSKKHKKSLRHSSTSPRRPVLLGPAPALHLRSQHQGPLRASQSFWELEQLLHSWSSMSLCTQFLGPESLCHALVPHGVERCPGWGIVGGFVLCASQALWIRYRIWIDSRCGPPCGTETFAGVRSVGADSATQRRH